MIKMEGMEQLVKKIEQMGLQGERIRDKAVKVGGDYLQEKVKDNVYSLGLHKRSGDLEKAILTSEVKDGKVDIGVTNTGDGFYGYFHEFGTSKMPARPFLVPTLENEIKNIEKKMAEEVKRGLGL